MNKFGLVLCLIFTSFCLQAQPPQGGGRGMGGGNRQGPPPGMGQRGDARVGEAELRLDSFPEIPAITLEQRVDIGLFLAKEQKDISKHVRGKHELMEKDRQSPDKSEKEQAKIQKNMAKIDAKIQKRIEQSNKKIKKILSDEQYRVFLEKRNDFRFKRTPPPGFRPPEGGERRRPESGGNREFRQGNRYP